MVLFLYLRRGLIDHEVIATGRADSVDFAGVGSCSGRLRAARAESSSRTTIVRATPGQAPATYG